jgi:hypothetical protein
MNESEAKYAESCEKKLEDKLLHRFQTGSGAYSAYAQSVPGVLCPTVRRPMCEADHSPSLSAENESAWNSNFTPTYRDAFVA